MSDALGLGRSNFGQGRVFRVQSKPSKQPIGLWSCGWFISQKIANSYANHVSSMHIKGAIAVSMRQVVWRGKIFKQSDPKIPIDLRLNYQDPTPPPPLFFFFNYISSLHGHRFALRAT